MVTGSHIPFDRNGIKFNRSGGEVLKEDEAPILDAVARVRAREYARAPADSPFDDAGAFRTGRAPELPAPDEAAETRYRRRYLDAFPAGALEGLRIAFYEHSAVGRDLLPDLLEDLGADVVRVGRSDTFIPIDTEAISAERLAELQALADRVRAEHGSLDALVSTDGDSDRPMLLGMDEAGGVRFFGGDVLGAVVAEYVGADAIVVPVSANDAIDRHFEPRGVPVVRTRIGSPWVIAEMARTDADRIVGWEANGGFLVGSRLELEGGTLEPLPTRDAALPLLAALHAARRDGISLVELFGRLPARFSRAALLDQVPRPRSLAVLEAFGPGDPALRGVRWEEDGIVVVPREGPERPAAGTEAARLHELRRRLTAHLAPAGLGELRALDALDGLRLSVAGGEVAHVRPSGNAPQLRIYATADTPERARAIVEEGVREPDGLLRGLLAGAEARDGSGEG
jgi:phosphomannomutase